MQIKFPLIGFAIVLTYPIFVFWERVENHSNGVHYK